jgi:hypothetical protein
MILGSRHVLPGCSAGRERRSRRAGIICFEYLSN